MEAAFDGGSHSVIAKNGVLGRPPLNIDDCVLSSASSPCVLVEQPGLTDMSYSSMAHDALICWWRLTHIPTDSEGQAMQIRQEWSNRSKIVADWEQRMRERYLQYCDSKRPHQRFMKFVGEDMIRTMRLLERRPMHRLFSAGTRPADDFNVLELATDIVERSLLKFNDPSLAPWSWFAWVKWYASGSHHACRALRAWQWGVEKLRLECGGGGLSIFAEVVIDNVLWRSVEKLMRKAPFRCRGSSLFANTPVGLRETSSRENTDSSNLSNNEKDQFHGIARAHEGISQSGHVSEAPAETDQSRTQLLPVDVDDSVPDASMDDSGYMSWVNWELFVQDVGNLSERDALEASLGGWLCGTRWMRTWIFALQVFSSSNAEAALTHQGCFSRLLGICRSALFVQLTTPFRDVADQLHPFSIVTQTAPYTRLWTKLPAILHPPPPST